MFTEKHEKMCVLQKLNSALFTIDNYNWDNSIILDFDKIKKYAVGWCDGDKVAVRPKENDIAVMYEVFDDDKLENYGRYWCHLDKYSFAELFIPNFWGDE